MTQFLQEKTKYLAHMPVSCVERLTGVTREQLRVLHKSGVITRASQPSNRIEYDLAQVLMLEVLLHLRGVVSMQKATEVMTSVAEGTLREILSGSKCFVVGKDLFAWSGDPEGECFLDSIPSGELFFAVVESKGSLLEGLKSRAKLLGLESIDFGLET